MLPVCRLQGGQRARIHKQKRLSEVGAVTRWRKKVVGLPLIKASGNSTRPQIGLNMLTGDIECPSDKIAIQICCQMRVLEALRCRLKFSEGGRKLSLSNCR